MIYMACPPLYSHYKPARQISFRKSFKNMCGNSDAGLPVLSTALAFNIPPVRSELSMTYLEDSPQVISSHQTHMEAILHNYYKQRRPVLFGYGHPAHCQSSAPAGLFP